MSKISPGEDPEVEAKNSRRMNCDCCAIAINVYAPPPLTPAAAVAAGRPWLWPPGRGNRLPSDSEEVTTAALT